MKKKSLQDNEKKEFVPKKIPMREFKKMNINNVRKIINVYGRILIYTGNGDIFELKEIEI